MYKLTIRSVIDYALSVYHKNVKQKNIARLDKLHYRDSQIVTAALYFTSKDKQNSELGWETLWKGVIFLA